MFSFAASGSLSLPWKKVNTLGWSRSRAATAAAWLAALALMSALQRLEFCSHLLQHCQPGMARIPIRSSCANMSSGGKLPSNRMALRPMFLMYVSWSCTLRAE